MDRNQAFMVRALLTGMVIVAPYALRADCATWWPPWAASPCKGRRRATADTVTEWRQGRVPGMTFYYRALSRHGGEGLARLEGRTRPLSGKGAFDEARRRLGSDADPLLLARLSMLLLEDGVAGADPWTEPGHYSAAENRVAKAPSMRGDTLEYWRRHQQLANLVRVRLDLETGNIEEKVADDIAREEALAVDPWPVVEADLASDNYAAALRGVRTLEDLGTPEAARALQKVARSHSDYPVRAGAALAVGRLGGDGALNTLLTTVVGDSNAEVRRAAVVGLVSLGDARALEILETVADSDSSPSVKAEAQLAIDRWE